MDVPSPTDVVIAPQTQIGRLAQVIRTSTPDEPDWLIPGMIAPGQVTELNAREKAGKGYLLHYLIGSLERGEGTFRGPTQQARTLIYTEEPVQALKEKFDLFDINEAMVVYHWELGAKNWLEVVDWLVQNAVRLDAKVIFIDNVSAATKTQDEAGVELARKIEPLAAKAKEFGLAVVYDRHQRKAQGRVEDKSRGSTSLAGAVDVIVAMDKADSQTRERTLTAWGRLWGHNWTAQIELTEDHKDYVALQGDFKTRILLERPQWTAAEYSEAIGKSKDTARDYLENHPHVAVNKGGGKHGADLFVVTAPPTLD